MGVSPVAGTAGRPEEPRVARGCEGGCGAAGEAAPVGDPCDPCPACKDGSCRCPKDVVTVGGKRSDDPPTKDPGVNGPEGDPKKRKRRKKHRDDAEPALLGRIGAAVHAALRAGATGPMPPLAGHLGPNPGAVLGSVGAFGSASPVGADRWSSDVPVTGSPDAGAVGVQLLRQVFPELARQLAAGQVAPDSTTTQEATLPRGSFLDDAGGRVVRSANALTPGAAGDPRVMSQSPVAAPSIPPPGGGPEESELHGRFAIVSFRGRGTGREVYSISLPARYRAAPGPSPVAGGGVQENEEARSVASDGLTGGPSSRGTPGVGQGIGGADSLAPYVRFGDLGAAPPRGEVPADSQSVSAVDLPGRDGTPAERRAEWERAANDFDDNARRLDAMAESNLALQEEAYAKQSALNKEAKELDAKAAAEESQGRTEYAKRDRKKADAKREAAVKEGKRGAELGEKAAKQKKDAAANAAAAKACRKHAGRLGLLQLLLLHTLLLNVFAKLSGSAPGGSAPAAPGGGEETPTPPDGSAPPAGGGGSPPAAPPDPCEEKCGKCGCKCPEGDKGKDGPPPDAGPDSPPPSGGGGDSPPGPPAPRPPKDPRETGLGGGMPKSGGATLPSVPGGTPPLPPAGGGGAPPAGAAPAPDAPPVGESAGTSIPSEAATSSTEPTWKPPPPRPRPNTFFHLGGLPPGWWEWFRAWVDFLLKFRDTLELVNLPPEVKVLVDAMAEAEAKDPYAIETSASVDDLPEDVLRFLWNRLRSYLFGLVPRGEWNPDLFQGADTGVPLPDPAANLGAEKPPPPPRPPEALSPEEAAGRAEDSGVAAPDVAGDLAPGDAAGIADEVWSLFWEDPHLALALGGLIPGLGDLLDLLDALLYFFEGDYEGAATSVASAAPVAGTVLGLLKIQQRLRALFAFARNRAKFPALRRLLEAIERQLVELGVLEKEERAASELSSVSRIAPEGGPRPSGRRTRSGGKHWFDSKVEGQLGKRGWTKADVDDALQNPSRTVETRDIRYVPDGGGRLDEPATGYYSQRGGYVVRNDRTGEIIQVSNRNKPGWKGP